MTVTPYTYSFQYFACSIIGVGGNFSLAAGAGNANEGITFRMKGDKNILEMGLGGQGQHNLIESDAGECDIRLLKTSPVNQQLDQMYQLQKVSGLGWGANVISATNTASGDSITASGVAFKKKPDLIYALQGGFQTWTFDIIQLESTLGGGVLSSLINTIASVA